MKLRPLSTVPAGTLDTILVACLLCFVSMGRSSLGLVGEGVSGVLKGCAADVDVAAGLSLGRPTDAVVSCADTACARVEVLLEKARRVAAGASRTASRRIHCRQIMVMILARVVQGELVLVEMRWMSRSMIIVNVNASSSLS